MAINLDRFVRTSTVEEALAVFKAYNKGRIPHFLQYHADEIVQSLLDLGQLSFNPLQRELPVVTTVVL